MATNLLVDAEADQAIMRHPIQVELDTSLWDAIGQLYQNCRSCALNAQEHNHHQPIIHLEFSNQELIANSDHLRDDLPNKDASVIHVSDSLMNGAASGSASDPSQAVDELNSALGDRDARGLGRNPWAAGHSPLNSEVAVVDLPVAEVRCVVVVDRGQLCGILSDRTVIRLLAKGVNLHRVKVGEVMSPIPCVLRQSEFKNPLVAINLMDQFGLEYLPLVDDQGQLVGLLNDEGLRRITNPVDWLRSRSVADALVTEVVCETTRASIAQITRLMAERDANCVVLVQLQEPDTLAADYPPIPKPVGVITESDLVQFQTLGLSAERVIVEDVMQAIEKPVQLQDSLLLTQQFMTRQNIQQVVVVRDDGSLLGLVTQRSILKLLNSSELYQWGISLEHKISQLEAEKLALLEQRTSELEQQIIDRTASLQRQAERDRLIANVASQIRSSLNLSEILNSTVQELRNLVQSDRAEIWQFQADQTMVIAAVALLNPSLAVPSSSVKDCCFMEGLSPLTKQGHVRVVNDIYAAQMTPCHRQLLERLQVRAKILIPLFQQENFWGLLAVVESNHPRYWRSEDIQLVQHLAMHLEIAIQQATAYEQLQMELHERRQTEEKLRASERRYVSLAKAIPVGIIRTNLKGKSLYINQRFCDILGLAARVIHQIGWERSIHPDDRAWVIEEMRHYRKQQQPFSLEYRIQRYQAGVCWVLAQSVPEYSDHEEVVGYITTITDITNQKKSEAALQQLNQDLEAKVLERTTALKSSEEQFRRLFEKEKVLSSVIRRIRQSLELESVLFNTAEEARQILFADRVVIYKVYEQSSGKIVAESRIDHCPSLLGMEFSAEVFPDSCHQKYMNGYVCTITDRDHEHLANCLSSFMQTLQIRAKLAVPIIEQKSNQLWGLLIAHQCSSQRYWCTGEVEFMQRLAEQCSIAIQQSELYAQLQESNLQLARATKLKDEFLANMSHELRTPLNAILGMAEVIQDGIYGEINNRQGQALKTIERSGTHLLELINDILDLAKIESGQILLNRAPTQINQLCQATITFVKQQALKKQIQLGVTIQPNLPDIFVDERRVRQVLINLLSNAIKFTADGGQVALTVSQIFERPINTLKYFTNSDSQSTEIQDAHAQNTKRSPSFISFKVTDTGIGISAVDLEKLFKPFIQIDSSLSRQYAGTGLGLSLVKRMVEMHQGLVSVTSEVGVGSCFEVCFPVMELANAPVTIPASQLDTSPTAITMDQPRPPVILLVEDNEANVNTISSYLKAKNYQILLAKDGVQAIEMAKLHRPDLILMDIQMPNLDGLTAMQQIRQTPELASTMIIALTALAMPGDRERCLSAGANDYFTKPIKLKQLAVKIQELLAAK